MKKWIFLIKTYEKIVINDKDNAISCTSKTQSQTTTN
jgi:hypothetical protein